MNLVLKLYCVYIEKPAKVLKTVVGFVQYTRVQPNLHPMVCVQVLVTAKVS